VTVDMWTRLRLQPHPSPHTRTFWLTCGIGTART